MGKITYTSGKERTRREEIIKKRRDLSQPKFAEIQAA